MDMFFFFSNDTMQKKPISTDPRPGKWAHLCSLLEGGKHSNNEWGFHFCAPYN